MLPGLPLFHRIAGRPVIVLGNGDAAMAKRRLVERAGGVVVDDLARGIDLGARLAFIADDHIGDVAAARAAGLLVNVVDRPDLCDFTTPSLVDRAPVLIAVGTGGASAGLAKAVRLRIDAMLPQGLGALADALFAARGALRARWPDAAARRRALDGALADGGALDPVRDHAANAVAAWLGGAGSVAAGPVAAGRHVFDLTGDDPDDLTLRQARLLGQADAIVAPAHVPPAILARARADALRLAPGEVEPDGLVVELRLPSP